MISSHDSRPLARRATLLALALVAPALALITGPGSALAATPQRYVMIVAYNNSQDEGVRPLRYADDDGVRYFELFRMSSDRVALFTVLDEETERLFPEAARVARPPTAEAIFSTLSRWNTAMEADSRAGRTPELVFIYAGHGDVDSQGEGYVNLLRSKLRRSDLYQRVLAPSKASYVHLIIDACKSYFLVNRRGGKWKDDSAVETHDDEIRAFLDRESLTTYPQVGVILATSGDQSTHEWNRFRGGILSHGLRSALAGSADINGDGRVEYSELQAFLASSTAQLRNPEARLNVFARPPMSNRHRPLMDLRDASRARLLRFGIGLAGRFYLQDDRGIRYADLNKAAGIRFDLAVERRRTYYIHRESTEAMVGPGQQRVAVSSLSFASSPLAMRGSLEQSFRKDLFRTAYSRGFYDGFCARTGLPPVEGGAVEFVISRPDEERSARRVHGLSLGYLASAALLDLDGFNHGVQLGYEYAVHPNITLGGTLEYARSTHVNPAQQDFSLHRFAALAGITARTHLVWRLDVRAELNLGYQGYFGSGPVWLNEVNVGDSSDTFGFRMEAGLGARLALTSLLFADLRGGLGVELVTLERGGKSEEHANTAPYFGLALGVAF